MGLRDYQERAVKGVFEAWKTHASTLVVLPTGCGKTIVFAEVIRRLITGSMESEVQVREKTDQILPSTSNFVSDTRRVLVLAHREELVFQARDKIMSFAGLDAEIEMAELHSGDFFGRRSPVIVSTIQTQGSGPKGAERMRKFDPREFAAIVVDEAHHAITRSYRRVLDYYMKANPDCRLLGVTATPDRRDEKALGQVFESVASSYGISEAISDGWLVPVRQQMVTVSSLDFSKIRTCAGDLNQAQLAKVMEEEENLHRIAAPTQEICRDKRAIVFAASVRHAERLAEILNRGDQTADWLCGESPKEKRREILNRFKSGELRFLVNVGVLTEGFDDAGVEAIVMARPTKSRALYAQMAGRATRPAAEIAAKLGEAGEGATSEADAASRRRVLIAQSSKPSCLILDFVGNAGRHKLISAADILGGKYDDEVVAEAKKRIARQDGRDARDVSESLEEARRVLEERKKQEAAARRVIQATARYMTTKIDPFDRYDLVRFASADVTSYQPLSPRETNHLEKAFGKARFERMTVGQRQALAEELRRRWRCGQASFRQEKNLAKHHIFAPMRADEARRAIEVFSRGWRTAR